jgi:hypothetical protein
MDRPQSDVQFTVDKKNGVQQVTFGQRSHLLSLGEVQDELEDFIAEDKADQLTDPVDA